jgi:chromosome segregation ATPase
MKKQTFDFMRSKGSSVKEINVSFSQSQEDKKENSSKSISNQQKDVQNNQSLAQVEISFWRKNISQLQEQYDSLKSFKVFKEKQLNLLKYELNFNNNNNYKIISKKKENEKKLKNIKNKYGEIESKLNNELFYLHKIQNEIGEHTMKKYKIKNEISRLKNILQKAQNDKKSKKTTISFNKIDTSEIHKQYKGLMTTTHGEMCRSRLGNKLLLSLNVDEINKHQVFDKMNLAYPVLKRKKIQFSYMGDGFNTKKLGKKKINLNDFNNFKVAGLPDGMQTVY